MTVLAVTGHRPDKLGGYKPTLKQTYIRMHMRQVLIAAKPSAVISGLALGIDWWWAEEAMNLGIPVCGAMAFAGQASRWPEKTQQEWNALLSRLSQLVIVSPGPYSRGVMQVRNEWMVDNTNILVAYWDGSAGGTKNCVDYAKKVGRDMVTYNPHDIAPIHLT